MKYTLFAFIKQVIPQRTGQRWFFCKHYRDARRQWNMQNAITTMEFWETRTAVTFIWHLSASRVDFSNFLYMSFYISSPVSFSYYFSLFLILSPFPLLSSTHPFSLSFSSTPQHTYKIIYSMQCQNLWAPDFCHQAVFSTHMLLRKLRVCRLVMKQVSKK